MEVDAAITSIETRQVSATISGLGVPVTSVRKPEKGMAVVKSGKETGVTFGIIEATDKLVSYRIWGRPLRHKIYVCAIKPDPARPAQGSFAARGDSGSCWMMVDSNGKPTDQMIGLHVGGDTSLKLAYACIAETVLSKLGLEPLAALGRQLRAGRTGIAGAFRVRRRTVVVGVAFALGVRIAIRRGLMRFGAFDWRAIGAV